MTQYPGHDPDDPFSRPPNEQGANPPAAPPPVPPATEETAPIQGEEMGYWERKAREDQQRLADEADQQARYGTGQSEGEPPIAGQEPPQQPVPENPWAGYGQPAPPHPQQGYGHQQPPPQQGYQQPAYGQPAYPAYAYPTQAPNHPQATTSLVLGLVGLIGGFITCGAVFLVSPFAWVTGAKAKREIAAANGQLGGHGSANTGFVLGIIGTVCLVLAVLAWGLIIALAVGDTGSSVTPTEY